MAAESVNDAAAAPARMRLSAAATAVAAMIPIAWFVAMGVSGRGRATTVMAISAGVLCIAILLVRGLDVRLLSPDLKTVAIGVAAAVAMIAATYSAFIAMARYSPALKEGTASLYGHLNGGRSSIAAALAVTGVVFAEEILWRGAFQSLVASYVRSHVGAVVITSMVYAAALASFGSTLLVLTGFACGLYWSGLRSWTGSVVPPLIAHVLWDVVLALVPLAA